MGQLDNVHIDVTALSQRIVLTRRSKRDPREALEKKDAMSEFWHAFVTYVGVGNEVQFGGGDEQFVARLEKYDPDAKDKMREELAEILEQIAEEGMPHPRHLDAALDAILTLTGRL